MSSTAATQSRTPSQRGCRLLRTANRLPLSGLRPGRLAPGGHLVVLVPAGPRLTSAFDRHVGHERRYTAQRLAQLVPDLPCRLLLHLDSVGTLASGGNRYEANQIAL